MLRFLLLFLCFPFFIAAQNVSLSGIINQYESILAIDTCTGLLEVQDTVGFPKNTRILMLQMQGASISTSNSATYGSVLNLGGAGFYEVNWIDSTANGQLFLRNKPNFAFDIAGQVQIVSYPSYAAATVTGTLSPAVWDGKTGGVLAFEVLGDLTLSAPISADGTGFRGGVGSFETDNNCNWALSQNDYAYPTGNWRGGNKGEGIAKITPGSERGRGSQANGGGGGNDHNAGGGGGGNQAKGGKGGENDEPSLFGCDGSFPGEAGRALNPSNPRIFLGGGGGAGHSNNNTTGSGGNGGGIILIKTKRLLDTSMITANGLAGEEANGDGGGGGGAGGTILLFVEENPSTLPSVTATGGAGGNTRNSNQNRCFGPGGGGAGGHLVSNIALAQSTGGQAGIVQMSTNGCNGSTNGAENGAMGAVTAWMLPESAVAYNGTQPAILTQPLDQSVCAGDLTVFSCAVAGLASTYTWQIWTGTMWENVPSNANFQSTDNVLTLNNPSLADNGAQFRCQIDFGACAAPLQTDAAFLTVSPQPSINFATNLNGQTVNFTNMSQNYDLLSWDFGDGTSSILENPNHTYIDEGSYAVVLTIWNACDTVQLSQTVTIAAVPTAIFMVPDTIQNCNIVNYLFESQSQGNITNLTWTIPNATPSVSNDPSVSVSFPSSGQYSAQLIVENGVGSDTLLQSFYVDILGPPNAAFAVQINGATVDFINQSSDFLFINWTFGDNSPSSMVENPSHTFTENGTYVITLAASNACGASILQQNVVITGVVGLAEQAPKAESLLIYPNPTKGQFIIDSKATEKIPNKVRVFANDGRLVLDKKWTGGSQAVFDLEKTASGLYFVQLWFADGSLVGDFLFVE